MRGQPRAFKSSREQPALTRAQPSADPVQRERQCGQRQGGAACAKCPCQVPVPSACTKCLYQVPVGARPRGRKERGGGKDQPREKARGQRGRVRALARRPLSHRPSQLESIRRLGGAVVRRRLVLGNDEVERRLHRHVVLARDHQAVAILPHGTPPPRAQRTHARGRVGGWVGRVGGWVGHGRMGAALTHNTGAQRWCGEVRCGRVGGERMGGGGNGGGRRVPVAGSGRRGRWRAAGGGGGGGRWAAAPAALGPYRSHRGSAR